MLKIDLPTKPKRDSIAKSLKKSVSLFIPLTTESGESSTSIS